MTRWGGLGDLFVCLPAVRLLRAGFPAAALTLIARAEYGALFRQAGVVDTVVGLDDPRTRTLFSGGGAPGGAGSGRLGGFDLAVSWLKRPPAGSEGAGPVGEGSGTNHLEIAYDPGGNETVGEFFYRRTLGDLGERLAAAPDFACCARLPALPSPERPEVQALRARALRRPLAVIHPGSGGERKRWPLDNFLAIAGCLRDKGVNGIFVTGPAEEALDRKVVDTSRSLGWTVLRSPDLLALGRILERADLYLGNDSGITHLAAACGARVLAIFLSEFVEAWRPYGRSRVLSASVPARIGVNSVWQKVAQELCI